MDTLILLIMLFLACVWFCSFLENVKTGKAPFFVRALSLFLAIVFWVVSITVLVQKIISS